MSIAIGQVIAQQYRIDAFLGKGGMAEVYKIWDLQMAAYLALKLLNEDLAEDKVFLRRFNREAQTLAVLQHPHIVRFYGLEKTRDLVYILMEYVEGVTLRKEISRADEPLGLERILEIIQPVCSALYYAHNRGLVHCDVKPPNIMLHKNGTVLLADFGIARMTETSTTTTLVGAGTPAYMAPEQILGGLPIPQTDIYALGIVLYEMLTGGERPFVGEQARITGTTAEKVRWEHLNLAPVSPRRYNHELSPALEAVTLKCLEKDPVRRFGNALDLYNALRYAIPRPVAPVQIIKEPSQKSIAETDEPFSKAINVEDNFKSKEPEELSDEGIRHEPDPQNDGKGAWNVLSVAKKRLQSFNLRKITGNKKILYFGLTGISALIILFIILNINTHPQVLQIPIAQNFNLYFTSNRVGKSEVYRLSAEGKVVQMTATQKDLESWGASATNRDEIYFTSNRGGKREIYRLKPGSVTEEMTYTPGLAESWGVAVNDRGGVFFTSNRDGKSEIYRFTDKGIQRMTNSPANSESWDPAIDNDGHVCFTSNRDGKSEIYRFNGKINQVERMTYSPGTSESWDCALDFAGNFYFTTNRTGKREIFRIGTHGLEQMTHSQLTVESWEPEIGPYSELYFVSNRDGNKEVYRLSNTGVIQMTNSPGSSESWLLEK